jgi:shikimate dehydrogenase
MALEEYGVEERRDLSGQPSAAAAKSPPIRVGLVGQHIQLSRTPRMHEAEGAAQGLDYRYDLLDTAAGTDGPLAEIVDRAEAGGFAGLNVTFPYKQAVLPLLDEISAAARRITSVNTIVFRDGRRFGHNTDHWGFAEGFRRGLPGAETSTVLLIGAGGAGSAVGHALLDLGAERILVSDTRSGAVQELVASINSAAKSEVAEAAGALETAAARADGIVNATPMGMAKLPGLPLDPGLLESRHWVADIVYFPLETELLSAARAKGCRVLSGEGMAVFQAVRAFALFTGREPDADRMRAAFRAFGDA